MTMFTNIHVDDDDGYESQSCDFVSVDNDPTIPNNDKQISITVSYSSAMTTDSAVTASNRQSATEICTNTNCHTENLSGKMNKAVIAPSEDKYNLPVQFDELEELGTLSVIVDGTEVSCRGPSVDVKKVFQKDEDGDTLLHTALIILSAELAFNIIDRSPCFTWLNIKNKIFQVPLHLAVLTNQVPLVRRLVVGGADVESRDQDGNMPIHLACRDNLLNSVRALLDPVSHEEQKRNNYEMPCQNIPQNLNAKNYDGVSCLHLAALGNNLEVVKTLLEYDADVNERAEKSGRTILHEAAWAGNVKLVKFLISLGQQCDINARTYDDYTAFDLARSRGHWSIVMELATAGAKYADQKDLE